MARGFIGNKSMQYFQDVSNTLRMSNNVLSSTGGRSNPITESGDELARDFLTGIGNASNIVVDEELYYETLKKINQTDQELADTIIEIITQIETMCENDFVLSDTTPLVKATVEAIKNTMEEFREVTENATQVAQDFVTQISEADS